MIVFIDNILVYLGSPEDHADHLSEVLQTLDQHKLYMTFSKCEFLFASLTLLGHVAYSEGIKANP